MLSLFVGLFSMAFAAGDYTIKPVPFEKVKFQDNFWAWRLQTALDVTIPHVFRKCEETGRIANFEVAGGLKKGKFVGRRYNDSDVFKTMEGGAYYLMLRKDPKMESYMDQLIAKVAAAQEEDGYLYTARTIDPKNLPPGTGPQRWSNLFSSHELYNVGHMYEAAVAYYQATGKDNFLKVALKNAELIYREFLQKKRCAYPGHQEIEIGLVKLYRVTGDRRYLELADYFLHQRGRCPFRKMFPSESAFKVYNFPWYMQAHKPVEQQREAVGHAVRALYMYSAMLDVGVLTGKKAYIEAAKAIWEDIVKGKIYLTGGVGSRHEGEAFGKPYELPNAEAYCETCASIANVFFNHRLFLLTGDGKYLDVLERTLYNALLAGISLSGDLFFYVNPLESKGDLERKPWYECACCPTNLARFLPSVGKYFYAFTDDAVYLTLYAESQVVLPVAGGKVKIVEKTRYPWDGRILVEVYPEGAGEFSLYLRVPGWAVEKPIPSDLYRFKGASAEKPLLRLNGKTIPLKVEKGFVRIRRSWKKGDKVELLLPMPVRRITAHPAVLADRGKVAFQRGPVVFCFEGADNAGKVLGRKLAASFRFKALYRPQLLRGVVVLEGRDKEGKPLVAIPYYAWANRGRNEMAVWLAQ